MYKNTKLEMSENRCAVIDKTLMDDNNILAMILQDGTEMFQSDKNILPTTVYLKNFTNCIYTTVGINRKAH